jgi:hypothetical protein
MPVNQAFPACGTQIQRGVTDVEDLLLHSIERLLGVAGGQLRRGVADPCPLGGVEARRRLRRVVRRGVDAGILQRLPQGRDPGDQELPVGGHVVGCLVAQVLEDRQRLQQRAAVAAVDDVAEVGLVTPHDVAVAGPSAAAAHQHGGDQARRDGVDRAGPDHAPS